MSLLSWYTISHHNLERREDLAKILGDTEELERIKQDRWQFYKDVEKIKWYYQQPLWKRMLGLVKNPFSN